MSQIGRYSGKETGGNPGYPRGTRNGRIPLSLLRRAESQGQFGCGDPRGYLWPAASVGLDLLAAAAKKDGITLRILTGYRTYEEQVEQRRQWTARGKPSYAAVPGRSSHGWATAIDVDRHGPGTRGIVEWLKQNATRGGFDHPLWAGDGVGTEEPWHWQHIVRWQPPEGETMPDDLKQIAVTLDGKPVEARAVLIDGASYISTADLSRAMGWPGPTWKPPREVNIRTK